MTDLLDEILTNNSGNILLTKLLSLNKHPVLSTQSRAMALKYIKQGRDIGQYLQNHHGLESLDQEWVESTTKKNNTDMEKLDEELRSYKSSHIKESIRMAYMDSGDLYASIGDYPNAVKSLTRGKDYCTTPKHNMEICMKLIHLYMITMSWQQMTLQISKAESLLDIPEKYGYHTKLKCYQGIVYMHTGRYAQAANIFLSLNFHIVEESKDVR